MTEHVTSNHQTGLEIAVIGINGRFPGARNIEEFWSNLREGVESIIRFTDDEQIAAGVPRDVLRLPNYVNAGTVLDDADLFDASFFGYSPREAEMMDPQHRIFLECAWETLESAGYDAERCGGRIGVFAGVSMSTYLLFYLYPNRELINAVGEFQTLIGNDKDFLPTRVSYKLNLNGPSLNVQTACSTSLVAVHLACQSLLAGECDLAFAGGVSVAVPQKVGYFYEQGGIASPDGHCRAFDAMAQGTVSGNGVGITLLKRLADAIADGDTIHAVIKGSAVNNDGSARAGYTAPSVRGQAAVITDALNIAEVAADTITYVEAHGSGTQLGDPIEVAALTRAFRAGTERRNFCAIGSVKTNVGHLDAAAGVTSLIKTVLALKHRMLPPSLHFTQPNPQIDFATSPFYVNTRSSEWKTNGFPLRAGVSSFGLGGTNAHVIVEESPPVETADKSRPCQLLLLSAKSSPALDRATSNLAQALKKSDGHLDLADAAYTLQVGRKEFNHRRVLVCKNTADAVTALEREDPERLLTRFQDSTDRSIVLMFSGLGDQYVNMGRGLYRYEQTFRDHVDNCAEILKPHLGLDLRDVLYPNVAQQPNETVQPAAAAPVPGRGLDLRKMLQRDRTPADGASQKLNQTFITQPAVFVLEYALSQLWTEWGVRPQAMIGYSIGEYVAACLAGVISLADVLLLVAQRARLIEKLPGGAMLAVPLSPAEIEPLLDHQLSLSATNGPSLCVVAGEMTAIADLEQQLAEKGLVYRRLQTSHAFHSRMMEPTAEALTELVQEIELRPPQIPFVSNITGEWIKAGEATDPSYWARHMCETVRFAEGLRTLWREPNKIMVEVGPGQTLSTLARSHPEKPVDWDVVSSVRHSYDRQADEAYLLNALGSLWLAGAHIDWSGFYKHERRRRVMLPTYPFERQRYWVQRTRQVAENGVGSIKKRQMADWFYVPLWKQSTPPAQLAVGELAQSQDRWLLFLDNCGFGARLAQRLEQEGQAVFTITAGDRFKRLDTHSYTINPGRVDDYDSLIKELYEAGHSFTHIVHLWNVTEDVGGPALDLYEESQLLGFYSLLFLAQSLGNRNIKESLDIYVMTNNMHAVSGQENLRPEKSTVLGPVNVIPIEFANIKCRSIDLVLPPRGTLKEEQLLDCLIAEYGAHACDDLVAYRENRRWVQTFEKLSLPGNCAHRPLLREGGVYLLTGGLGGIGLELAQFLAETVRAKLALIGRSAFPEPDQWEHWLATHDEVDSTSRKISKLQALEKAGAEVLVISADVTDERQVRSAIGRVKRRFGQINGVIHAAGIAGGGIIQVKAPAAAESVLAPKVKGTLVLDALLRDEKLDFVVLCSALASIAGGPAQVDYSAANSFLDAYTYYNAALRPETFTVTINWDTWREVGLAVNTFVPADLKAMRERDVEEGMSSQEGIEVFSRIMRSRVPQVIVSMTDLQAFRNQIKTFTADLLLEELEKNRQAQPLHSRPQLDNPYIAPRDELEQAVAGIWQTLLGIEPVGVHDNFFHLGGHSLLATQVISRLREMFQVELGLRRFFERATVAGLAEAVREQQRQEEIDTPPIHRTSRGDKDLEQLLAELDQLSTEEAQELLAIESGTDE